MLLVDLLELLSGVARIAGRQMRQRLVVKDIGRIDDGFRFGLVAAAGQDERERRNDHDQRQAATPAGSGDDVTHEALPKDPVLDSECGGRFKPFTIE